MRARGWRTRRTAGRRTGGRCGDESRRRRRRNRRPPGPRRDPPRRRAALPRRKSQSLGNVCMAPPVIPFWVRFCYGLTAILVFMSLSIVPALLDRHETRALAVVALGACLIPAAVLGTLAWRHERALRTRYERHLEGLCLECGYDMLLSRQRCPECGAPVLPAQRYPALATFFALHYSVDPRDPRLPGVVPGPSQWAVDRVRVAQELRRFLAEDYDEEATARILALDF